MPYLRNDNVSYSMESNIPSFPPLKDYVNAVFREMYYIRENGGKKHKLTNGRVIVERNDAAYYSFDSESELNLADDSPVTVTVGENDYSGFVFSCDGFRLTVALNANIGNSIPEAAITVEPWKLLQKLGNRLSNITENDRIAIKLFTEGPRLAEKSPTTDIAKGQENAVKKAEENEITVIWGPPGTGKTYTMSEIARRFLNKGYKILIVSHSNISVDNVIKSIDARLRENGQTAPLERGKVLRYGYVRDNELKKNDNVVSFNRAAMENKDLYNNYVSLSSALERIKAKPSEFLSRDEQKQKIELERQIRTIKAAVKSKEKALVQSADIIATTVSKLYIDPIFEEAKYDVVMFDEVSMAYVPQVICAASFAAKRFIGVGDFRQLPPIVQSESKTLLEKDIFSFLNITDVYYNVHSHPWLVLLDEQRRMHPDISAFSGRIVYKGLVKNHPSVKTKWEKVIAAEPFSNCPMNLINTSGLYFAAGKNSDNSRFNILSALISLATAKKAYQGQNALDYENETKVGIVTPYAAQTRLIRAMLADEKIKEISCATVHQFQGSERNVIVFDAVESYPTTKTGWLVTNNNNDSVTRLINVAITRTRAKLIAVANETFWFNRFEGGNNLLYLLIKHLKQKGNNITVSEGKLKNYLRSLDYGDKTDVFFSYDECKDIVQNDIKNAKSELYISVPQTEMDAQSQNDIISILGEKGKSVKIICKAKSFNKLPLDWKRISVRSEDANFPIIVIDDKILWYGIPAPTGAFIDGNKGYSAICHLFVRFGGSHTVEMIKSLANTEKAVSKSDRIFDETGENPEAGFAYYIKLHEKCPECNKPMTFAKGRSGKFYLRCSGCPKTNFISVDTVSNYIREENVKCPKCGSPLTAGISKYGLYARCVRGHFSGVDEI